MHDIEVIVLAAGRGERLGGSPKAFLELDGKTLLERAVGLARQLTDSVIAAVPAAGLERAAATVGARARLIAGGPSRGATFRNLLGVVDARTVVVLDVVHPFVSIDLCRRVLAAAGDGAAAAVAKVDELVIAADGAAPTGDQLYMLQKPIVFRLADIKRGLAQASGPDAGVVELLRLAGTPIHLVEAGLWNVKLTTNRDWEMISLLADRLAEEAGPS